MGNAQASLTKQTLESYTEVMNNTIAKEYNKTSLGCSTGNVVSFTTGRDCYFSCNGCDIEIGQKATSECTLDGENTNQIQSTIQDLVQSTTESFIENDLKNKQGWFSTAFSLQISGASTKEEVSNIISNQFSGDITNICQGQIDTFNTGVVDLCGDFNNTKINFNQDALTTALVSCINNNIIEVFNTNSALNQLYTETDNVLVSQQKGARSFLWLLIILGIIFFLIIVAVIVFMIFKGKQSQQQQTPQYIPIPVKSSTTSRTAAPATVQRTAT